MTRNGARSSAKVVLLLGPPGSGKGTQAAQLSRTLSIPAISTGAMLRRECEVDSALGRRVRDTLAAGRLVSDGLINEAVSLRVKQPDCDSGFILDGYPRTVPQVIYLDGLLFGLDLPQPVVFDFQISASDAIARLGRRLQCILCGQIYGTNRNRILLRCEQDGGELIQREDDNAASIAERLEIYQTNSQDLVSFCQRYTYFPVPAQRNPEHIQGELCSILMSREQARAAYHS